MIISWFRCEIYFIAISFFQFVHYVLVLVDFNVFSKNFFILIFTLNISKDNITWKSVNSRLICSVFVSDYVIMKLFARLLNLFSKHKSKQTSRHTSNKPKIPQLCRNSAHSKATQYTGLFINVKWSIRGSHEDTLRMKSKPIINSIQLLKLKKIIYLTAEI